MSRAIFYAVGLYVPGRVPHRVGRCERSASSYRLGLEVEQKKPHHRTQACYDFGKLVVENKMIKLYNEALKILDKMAETDCPLPVQAYKENGVRAIVAAHKKQFTKQRNMPR